MIFNKDESLKIKDDSLNCKDYFIRFRDLFISSHIYSLDFKE